MDTYSKELESRIDEIEEREQTQAYVETKFRRKDYIIAGIAGLLCLIGIIYGAFL